MRRIGVLLPITGSNGLDLSSVGNDVARSAEFACNELGLPLKLLIQDDRGDSERAAKLAGDFFRDGITEIFGLSISGVAGQIAELIQNDVSKVAFSSMASSPELSRFSDCLFRTRPSDARAIELLSDYVAKKGLKKVAAVTEAFPYPLASTVLLRSWLEKREISLVESQFSLKHPITGESLAALLRSGADAIFLCTQTEQSFLTQLEIARAFNLPILALGMPGSRKFLDLAGNSADGITFVSLDAVGNEEMRVFYQKFIKAGGPVRSVPYVFPTTVAALVTLAAVIDTSGIARHALATRAFYHDLLGTFRFTNGELNLSSFSLKGIHNGKIISA